jgi:hypothetical protein
MTVLNLTYGLGLIEGGIKLLVDFDWNGQRAATEQGNMTMIGHINFCILRIII